MIKRRITYCAPFTGKFYPLFLSFFVLFVFLSFFWSIFPVNKHLFTYKHMHTHVWPAVCFSGGVCVYLCGMFASYSRVCLCKAGMWIILMPSFHFILEYLPKMTCRFCVFEVFDLIYSYKKLLLFFTPNSFMDSFVDGLRHVILPAVHVASWHHFLCPSSQELFCENWPRLSLRCR